MEKEDMFSLTCDSAGSEQFQVQLDVQENDSYILLPS